MDFSERAAGAGGAALIESGDGGSEAGAGSGSGSVSDAATELSRRRKAMLWFVGSAVVFAGLALFAVALWTAPVRGAVRSFTLLLNAVNRGEVEEVRALCSSRYLASHELELAPEGGVTGFPRGMHKNFRAWREGGDVWICPTNRVGPVFRFVREGGGWRFDGLAGVLDGRGGFLEAKEGVGGLVPGAGVN